MGTGSTTSGVCGRGSGCGRSREAESHRRDRECRHRGPDPIFRFCLHGCSSRSCMLPMSKRPPPTIRKCLPPKTLSGSYTSTCKIAMNFDAFPLGARRHRAIEGSLSCTQSAVNSLCCEITVCCGFSVTAQGRLTNVCLRGAGCSDTSGASCACAACTTEVLCAVSSLCSEFSAATDCSAD